MKRLIVSILLMTVSSFSMADCRLELDPYEILINTADFSRSTPEGLVKTLQKKGYQVRARNYADDFAGAPNMILKGDILNQHQGQYGEHMATGMGLTLLSADGTILAEGSSYSVLPAGIPYFPNHIKKAIKKLPDCKDL